MSLSDWLVLAGCACVVVAAALLWSLPTALLILGLILVVAGVVIANYEAEKRNGRTE